MAVISDMDTLAFLSSDEVFVTGHRLSLSDIEARRRLSEAASVVVTESWVLRTTRVSSGSEPWPETGSDCTRIEDRGLQYVAHARIKPELLEWLGEDLMGSLNHLIPEADWLLAEHPNALGRWYLAGRFWLAATQQGAVVETQSLTRLDRLDEHISAFRYRTQIEHALVDVSDRHPCNDCAVSGC